jgi:hypothetical protein
MVEEVVVVALQCSNYHDSLLFYFGCSHLRGHVNYVSALVPQSAKYHVRLKMICVHGDVAAVGVGPVKTGEGTAGTHDRVSRIVAVD